MTEARVHFTTGRIEVEHNPDRVTTDVLVKTVRDAGYNATVTVF